MRRRTSAARSVVSERVASIGVVRVGAGLGSSIAVVASGLALPLTANADDGPQPRILTVSYKASHEFKTGGRQPAIVVRARDRDGRIVRVTVKGRRIAVGTSGGCGRRGSPRGALHRYFLPVRRLPRGPHRLSVRAQSSSCDTAKLTQSVTRKVTVRVSDRAPS